MCEEGGENLLDAVTGLSGMSTDVIKPAFSKHIIWVLLLLFNVDPTYNQ